MSSQTDNKKIVIIALGLLGLSIFASATYTIPEDQFDEQKIYFGNALSFESPAAVSIETVIKATPEYDEIKKNKIEKGTGKYWILINQAQERSVLAISKVAEETDYDLIAEDGYLDALKPAIPNVDITKTVVEKVGE